MKRKINLEKYKPQNKQKTKITKCYYVAVKELYNKGKDYIYTAKKLGFTQITVKKYYDRIRTVKFVGSDGLTRKRCTKCDTEKLINRFYKTGKYYQSRCKDCDKLRQQNKVKLEKNLGIREQSLVKTRANYNKNKNKRNEMRRIGNLSDEKQEAKRQKWSERYKKHKIKVNKRRRFLRYVRFYNYLLLGSTFLK